MTRLIAGLLSLMVLAACSGADTFAPAPMSEVQRRAYVHDGPPEITLYTVLNVTNGSGAHTALLINGDQRVLWDPAGSFRHPHVPERGDVHYGITENIRKAYVDYHVRPNFSMEVQTLRVSEAQARELIRLAEAHGSANRSTCARSTSGILREAGIDVGRTWFPKSLMRSFAEVPGVRSELFDNTNVDTSHDVVFDTELATPLPVY
ncbi:hypothetical protein [Palleronia sp. LCG004]|uniref:hypothetical protein n=1 Tax=Palleronia sp. LCG004 TaxID=3079304 RepID=UPI002943950B|nr:hypothetical protein [Palleronia sp. LCG004]WOI55416.1 hypothetical protein RVY76_10205 [Palleronia sp. LCG004]